MADVYVVDAQEEYPALLTGTYTVDQPNCVLTLGADGQADTTLILPTTTAWYIIEVYNVEGVVGAIGYTEFSENITTMDASILTARTTALAEYTTFKIAVTHYIGDGTIDIYLGDETTAVALFNTSHELSYTPDTASWKLEIDILTPINKLLVCAQSYDCDDTWLC